MAWPKEKTKGEGVGWVVVSKPVPALGLSFFNLRNGKAVLFCLGCFFCCSKMMPDIDLILKKIDSPGLQAGDKGHGLLE